MTMAARLPKSGSAPAVAETRPTPTGEAVNFSENQRGTTMKTAKYIADNEVLACATELVERIAAGGLGELSLRAAGLLLANIAEEERDVLSQWLVSDWLAKKLAAKGERVERDFAGLAVWGRTIGGQSIEADDVICQIAADYAPPPPHAL